MPKSQLPNTKTHRFRSLFIWSLVIVCNLALGACNLPYLYGEETTKPEPIIVNGDTVEYSTNGKLVTASGNVSVDYKGSILTCQKLTVNVETKDAEANGNVRLDDQKGVIEGAKLIYNFQTKAGMMIDGQFRSNPYFGKSKTVNKISDAEFIALNGYMTSCSYDKPHYRMASSKIDMFPGDKIQTKNDTFYVNKVPLLYLPKYNRSLKDPFMHVQVTPGKRKDWGPYLLTATRYNLTDNISGRIYLDYRSNLGIAEGFGTNYTSPDFGKGDFKYYYTQERDKSKGVVKDVTIPKVFQRYLVRWRHNWDVDPRTKATIEYYRIVDSKMAPRGSNYQFLKDYFYREYEKDAQPASYVLVSHTYDYASLSFFMQKRTNRWYPTYIEKLPEISLSLPDYKIAESPVYFSNSTIFSSLNRKFAVPSDSDDDVVRLDTYNQLSLPARASIFWVRPFVGARDTYYSKDNQGESLNPRTVFYSGMDLSTKFYRIFDFNSNFLGMDINGIRHIITPLAQFAYIHTPTIPFAKLQQFDSLDSISTSNKVALELTNKLQTKRSDNNKVDFAMLKVNTNYLFKPKGVPPLGSTGSSFSDFLFDLELLPYSWLRIDTDATYNHSAVNHYDGSYKRFSTVNYGMSLNLGQERSFGIGERYQRKGGKELTSELIWRLSPKWKFRIYERYQIANIPLYKNGLREQEYAFSRDLHCWIMDFTYNVSEDKGHAFWIIFRIKAFPEMEFGFDQSYHAPKTGSQSSP